MKYGLQLYSLRDIADKDFLGTIRETAKIGYSFIEPCSFFGTPAEDVCKVLDETGLYISGTHTGWDQLTPDKIDETIAYHKAVGNKNIIIPGIDLSTEEKLNFAIDLINSAQKKLAAAGITLGYHNHAREFLPVEFGCFHHPEFEHVHAELQKKTSVEFEIDTYWAYVAGKDPVEVLEGLKGRVHVVHVKDGFRPEIGKGDGRALGEGSAPVAAVREYCIKNGIRMVVESESCKPTGLEEVTRCFKYLKSLDAKGGN